MNGAAFRAYVEHVLAPKLGSGGIVVMDNLSTHLDLCAKLMIDGAVRAFFLPSYRPDLNPIEKMWSKAKAALCSLAARAQEALSCAIATALTRITSSDAKGWGGIRVLSGTLNKNLL